MWTNRGKLRMLEIALRRLFNGGALPTYYYVRLVTSAVAPTVDTNVVSELTEIAAGNGYTAGGYQVTPGAADFDVLTEDDIGDKSLIQLKNIIWTAVTGNLPASGNGARYAVLTDNHATDASREVLFAWDLVSDRTVSVGQTLTLIDLEIQATEPV